MSKNLSSILRSGSNTPTVANSDIPALANPSTGYLNWTGSAYAWTPNIVSTGIGATGVSTTVAGPLVVAESLSTASTGVSTASWATSGVNLKLQSRTYTDTSSTGTVASSYVNVMASPTLASTNAVTITNAASLFVDAPIASTNTTITNGWAIYAGGKIRATDLVLANALPVGQGGTGSTTAANALTALGAYAATNPSGFTSNTGTVTSIGITVPSFLSAGSAITTSGTIAISLSGTALPIANGGTGSTSTTFANLTTNVSGTLPIANGGTGATTLTGILKGNGTSAFTAASAGIDFLAPGGVLGTPSSGTLSSCTVDGTNAVGYKNIPQTGSDKTTAYELVLTDVGKYVGVGTSGSIVVPTAVFANGDAISIYNNTTGNITITTSAVTAYISGTNTAKTSITLATRGIATILFVSATVCVVSGNVL